MAQKSFKGLDRNWGTGEYILQAFYSFSSCKVLNHMYILCENMMILNYTYFNFFIESYIEYIYITIKKTLDKCVHALYSLVWDGVLNDSVVTTGGGTHARSRHRNLTFHGRDFFVKPYPLWEYFLKIFGSTIPCVKRILVKNTLL